MSDGAGDAGPGGDGGSDLLARATSALREAPERAPRWQDISEAVVTTLRAATRSTTRVTGTLERSTDPAAAGRDSAADSLQVSDLVLATVLRRALDDVAGCAPAAVEVHSDDAGRCTGLTLDVVAAFGTDLWAAADDVRTRAAAVLADVLGAESAPDAGTVEVRVTDVTDGDPRA